VEKGKGRGDNGGRVGKYQKGGGGGSHRQPFICPACPNPRKERRVEYYALSISKGGEKKNERKEGKRAVVYARIVCCVVADVHQRQEGERKKKGRRVFLDSGIRGRGEGEKSIRSAFNE